VSRATRLAVVLVLLASCGEEPATPRRARVRELELPSAAEREATEKLRDAEAFLEAEKPRLAEPLLERVLELRPDDRRAAELLARCRIERGKPEDAVPLLRRARQQPGRHAALRALLVQTLMQMGDFAEAEKEARAWTEVDAQAADAWFELGRCLYRLDRFEDAIQAFRRAEALKAARADIRSELGLALAAAGKLKEAEAKLRDAIERQPDYADAWFRLGDVAFRRDPARVHEAVDAMQRAVALQPSMLVGHLYLFRTTRVARLADDDPRRAELLARGEQAWREVLRIHGPSQTAPLLAGELRGQPDADERTLGEQVDLHPDDPAPRVALGRYLLADRRPEEARDAFRAAIRAGATEPRTRLLLASALLALALPAAPRAAAADAEKSAAHLREAEEACRAVLATAPHDSSTNRLLAWVLLLQGRDEEARASADTALEGAPDDVLAKKVRALARMHAGEVDAGLQEIAALGWL
jgi:tetratricopeptide (TPR) repeat protein